MQKKYYIRIFFICLLVVTYAFSITEEEAVQTVQESIAKAAAKDDAVQILIQLAWFDSSVPAEVSQAAKAVLKGYGQWSSFVLCRAVLDAPASVQKEMIPFILLAYDDKGTRHDPEYVSTFINLIRTAERDVKMMAMDALARYGVKDGAITIIDAAYEDPSLELHAIKALGGIRDPKAVSYLMDKLASPQKEIADAAEEALAGIASQASLSLKSGLIDDRQEVRERSLRIFLPLATIDDISLLYQVRQKSEHFDPKLLDKLQKKIDELNEERAQLEREAQEEERALQQLE